MVRLSRAVMVFVASAWMLGGTTVGAQPTGEPVTGVVQEFAENRVTLIDGASFAVADPVRVTVVTAATPADLTIGQFVAITAQRESGGVLEASIVSSFPEELRGTGEGQRPMDGGNLMTNASIDEATLTAVDGADLAVSFLGDSDRVRVSGDTRVELRRLGSLADVVPGATVTTVVTNGVSGNISVR